MWLMLLRSPSWIYWQATQSVFVSSTHTARWKINTTLIITEMHPCHEWALICSKASGPRLFIPSIRYTLSSCLIPVPAAAGSSSGWLAGVWVLARFPTSTRSLTQWSLSSWTAYSPLHPLLWHPSRSSWPQGTGPPYSKAGREFSRRRSKMEWGSVKSKRRGILSSKNWKLHLLLFPDVFQNNKKYKNELKQLNQTLAVVCFKQKVN